MELPVIFRKFKNGQLIALFPTLPALVGGEQAIKAYTPLKKHTQVETSIMYVTKEAIPEEYTDFLIEVAQEAYPHDKLVIRRRMTEGLHGKRRDIRVAEETIQAA